MNQWFWWAQLIPAGLLVCLWLAKRREDWKRANPEILKRRAVVATAQSRLGEARSAARRGDGAGFAKAGAQALAAAASSRESTSAESVTAVEVIGKLSHDEKARAAAAAIFDAFESGHFGRSGKEIDAKAMLPELVRTVKLLST
jgi:hypothetical protein